MASVKLEAYLNLRACAQVELPAHGSIPSLSKIMSYALTVNTPNNNPKKTLLKTASNPAAIA